MYKCFIRLVICSIDMSSGLVYVLSTEQNKLELPCSSLDNKDIKDIKSKLFERNVHLSSSWAAIKLIKPFLESDSLYLYYMAKVPFDTSINGFWLHSTTSCAIDSNIQDCIRYV